jgi:hypothetical protein
VVGNPEVESLHFDSESWMWTVAMPELRAI